MPVGQDLQFRVLRNCTDTNVYNMYLPKLSPNVAQPVVQEIEASEINMQIKCTTCYYAVISESVRL